MQPFHNRTILAFVFILLVTSLSAACIQHAPSYESDKMIPVGPEVKASLVIYFKVGVADEQIDDFWHNVLSRPHPQGRGYYHRTGVSETMRLLPVQGHEGIAITFSEDATQGQRYEVKQDINSSPIVYKVLENVAPNDVKKLD